MYAPGAQFAQRASSAAMKERSQRPSFIASMVSASLRPCACAWTNLNRYDQDHRPPKGAVLTEITTLDFLVREEITALRPDVCLFFTNRKHDSRLKAIYDGLKFSTVPSLHPRDFALLHHPELPTMTIRAPHPRYIRQSNQEAGVLANLTQHFKCR